ncbi:acyltransferase domain-containing protein, partial [Micromonospora sp. ATCC 39149]
GAVTLLTDAQPWPGDGRPRRAGVSSFGASGTNAHVILEEAPEPAVAEAAHPGDGAEDTGCPATPPVAWLLSARTDQALRDQAHRLAEHPTVSTHEPADVAHALATTRTRFEHRAVVLGTTRHELTTALAALAAGTTHPGLVTGVSTAQQHLAAVFTGQGAQRRGMGRTLHATFAAFRTALDEVCAAFDGPLLDTVLDDPDGTLHQTRWAQPAIFAVEVALYRLLESFGVTAHAMAGHSIGELTAAHLAGIWTLADAATVVTARADLMQRLPSGGGMLAVQASEAEALAWIGDHGLAGNLDVAAANSPHNTVLSGDQEHLTTAQRHFTALGRKTRPLRVSHAFHSHHMDDALDDFRAVVRGVTANPAAVPIISTVTGRLLTPEQAADPDYWAQQIRRTVRFHDAVTHLHTDGATTFLEIGPDAALTPHVRETATQATAVPTLRRNHDDTVALLTAVARLHTLGFPTIWAPLHPIPPATIPDLPTYPFQHQRYWLDGDGALPASRHARQQPSPSAEQRRDLAERLAAEPRERWVDVLLDTVRTEVNLVLGFSGEHHLDPDRPFSDLGFDSLTVLELTERLGVVTDAPVPARLVLDHPTARTLAGALSELVDRPAPVDQPGALLSLFQRACVEQRHPEGMALLAAAARLREATGELATGEPVVFSHGPRPPALFAFPSMVAPSNAYQFARFAGRFRDAADLSVLRHPGFVAGERLPESLAEVAAYQSATILRQTSEAPYVLIGYSSGGWMAHLVGERLAATGNPPAGVVLLDSHLPGSRGLAEIQGSLLREIYRDGAATAAASDAELTAMARYLELFEGWEPGHTGVPTLVVSAVTTYGDPPETGATRSPVEWPRPHRGVELAVDHLSMIEDLAHVTAGCVDDWLIEEYKHD